MKSSRTEATLLDDSKVDPSVRGPSIGPAVDTQDMPMPESAGGLLSDKTTADDDDSMLSIDKMIVARAIMGNDMTECISAAKVNKIIEECKR